MEQLKRINKRYLLIGGTCFLLLIGYQLAFKKTLEYWQIHRQLNEQLLQAADVSVEPGYIIRKKRNLDQILKAYQIDSVRFRSNTVDQIAQMAEQEHVRLIGIPADDPDYHAPRFIAQKLNIEGDFFSLLKLVNRLQTTPGIGLLRSVAWRVPKAGTDQSAKKLSLELFLVIPR